MEETPYLEAADDVFINVKETGREFVEAVDPVV